MPNTPAQIGQGVTVWCCTPNIESEERDRIERILSSFGKSIFVDDENYIDMSTSISGSGPAYIFLLMEAMIDAGVHMGFSRSTATTLVHHTLLGSTLYAMESKLHPAILRNSVTSPAGTTASAIYELENGKFRTVIKGKKCVCRFCVWLPLMTSCMHACMHVYWSIYLLFILICVCSFQDAIWACYRRSLEMGGEDSNVGPGRVPVTPIVFRPSHHPIEAPRGEIITEVEKDREEKDKNA